MISKSNLEKQLMRIHFNSNGWGRSEVKELSTVLMPGEEVDECVNGFYEAGFALLVATKDRLLLIDKKPLNYLTVEDMRFDMICEFDYSHRLIGAEVKIATSGNKTLHFTSWNQPRLRRLLSFVQFRMTEIKKMAQSHQEAQKAHLEQMNQQLQMYLAIQQYQYQQQMMQSGQAQGQGMPQLVSLMHPGAASASVQHHLISPAQIGVSAMKRVLPVISAYTRLPVMSQRRRFQNSTM